MNLDFRPFMSSAQASRLQEHKYLFCMDLPPDRSWSCGSRVDLVEYSIIERSDAPQDTAQKNQIVNDLYDGSKVKWFKSGIIHTYMYVCMCAHVCVLHCTSRGHSCAFLDLRISQSVFRLQIYIIKVNDQNIVIVHH